MNYSLYFIASVIELQLEIVKNEVKKKMIPYTIRFDDMLHRKLKVIASLHGDSLNRYMMKMFTKAILDWEKAHGEIEIPE